MARRGLTRRVAAGIAERARAEHHLQQRDASLAHPLVAGFAELDGVEAPQPGPGTGRRVAGQR